MNDELFVGHDRSGRKLYAGDPVMIHQHELFRGIVIRKEHDEALVSMMQARCIALGESTVEVIEVVMDGKLCAVANTIIESAELDVDRGWLTVTELTGWSPLP